MKCLLRHSRKYETHKQFCAMIFATVQCLFFVEIMDSRRRSSFRSFVEVFGVLAGRLNSFYGTNNMWTNSLVA